MRLVRAGRAAGPGGGWPRRRPLADRQAGHAPVLPCRDGCVRVVAGRGRAQTSRKGALEGGAGRATSPRAACTLWRRGVDSQQTASLSVCARHEMGWWQSGPATGGGGRAKSRRRARPRAAWCVRRPARHGRFPARRDGRAPPSLKRKNPPVGACQGGTMGSPPEPRYESRLTVPDMPLDWPTSTVWYLFAKLSR